MYKFLVNILFLQMLSLIGGPLPWNTAISEEPESRVLTEVPVLKLNFYLMGKDRITEKDAASIIENVAYMNEEFEGRVKFETQFVSTSLYTAYLPDLRADYMYQDGGMLDMLINPVEKNGAVNVFLFDTYFEEERNGSLMGFTPIMTARQDMYEQVTPMFDRIYMAYDGLENRTTLIHEMGHFLGLRHPWEMDDLHKHLMGLADAEDEEHNHMGYHPDVDAFTYKQLENMRDFALNYRSYLLKRVDYFYLSDYASN